MAFGSTDYLIAIPRVRNYAQAEKLYNAVKPVRGDNSNPRPIGIRRRKHERIEKNPQDGSYIIRLYGYAMLQYMPDDTIHVAQAPPWASHTLSLLLMKVLGVQSAKFSNCIWLAASGYGIPLVSSGIVIKEDVSPAGFNTFLHNVSAIQRKVVDLPEARKARSRIKDFVEFGTSMLKLSDGIITEETLEAAGAHRDSRFRMTVMPLQDDQIFDAMMDENKWVTAFAHVALRHTRSVTKQVGAEWRSVYKPDAFKRAAYKLHDSLSPEVYKIDEFPLQRKWVRMSNIMGLTLNDTLFPRPYV